MAERRAKYGNRPTIGDDCQSVYDSVLERDVARVLDLLTKGGRILGYDRQVSYTLARATKGQRSVEYVVDFRVYGSTRNVLVEAKGYMTPAARLKMRWFEQRYPDVPLRVVRDPAQVIGIVEEFEEFER